MLIKNRLEKIKDKASPRVCQSASRDVVFLVDDDFEPSRVAHVPYENTEGLADISSVLSKLHKTNISEPAFSRI